MLVLRSNRPLTDDIRQKIALYGGIPTNAVISAVDAGDIYEVPLNLEAEGFATVVCKRLGPPGAAAGPHRLAPPGGAHRRLRGARCGSRWSASTSSSTTPTCRWPRRSSTRPSTTASSCEIDWVDAEAPDLDDAARAQADGILVPGGFGGRGIEGKIAATRFARERGVPFLGICLGMQIAVIEYARHVCGMDGANSSEFDPETPYAVIDLLPEQRAIEERGGTMRLGADPVHLVEGTRARAAYGDQAVIYERHRHRYEVNPAMRERDRGGRASWSAAARPTGAWSRSSSSPTTPGSAPRSSTPSSRAGPPGRSRSSASSWAPRPRGRAAPATTAGARARARSAGEPGGARRAARGGPPDGAPVRDPLAVARGGAASPRLVRAELRASGAEVHEDDAAAAHRRPAAATSSARFAAHRARAACRSCSAPTSTPSR